MESHDIPGVEACFTPDATVTSKTYGRLSVDQFYRTLFAETVSTNISNIRIYRGDAINEWIARFSYRWQRQESGCCQANAKGLRLGCGWGETPLGSGYA